MKVKSEESSEDDNDDDDIILMSPLDDCITHKPSENKYDVVTGIIPFETVITISGILSLKLLI